MEDASFLLRRNLGVVFVTVPFGLFVFSKLFPDRAKKIKQKCGAWIIDRVMLSVHSKCVQEKTDLFKSFDLLKSGRPKPEVLEIGVGSGNNLSFFPSPCSLSCLEPNLEFQQYVKHNLERYPGVHLTKFVKGFAENMKEFEDNTFDAVVCTFTMCSVRHPEKALSEIKRVLKPGGVYFFMEHVAAPKPSTFRSVQECIDVVWPTLADGCHLTREMWNSVEKAGFTEVKLTHFQMKTKLVFIKFMLYGHAVK